MSFRKTERGGRKTDNAAVLAVECEKTILAAAIGRNTGLFYVPEVLGYSAEQGVLDTEWIDGLEPLMSVALQRDPRMSELCHRTGAALAAIHKELRLPEKLKVQLPVKTANRDADVFLHGDFNGNNVCYDRKTDRLVIVDWSSAPILGGKPTFGSRYFDLIWFGHYLFCSRPGLWIGSWKAKTWYQSFVLGYRSRPCCSLSDEEFRDFRREIDPVLAASQRQTLKKYPRWRRIGRYLLFSYGRFRWQRCGF